MAGLPDGPTVVAIDFDATWHPAIFERVGYFVVDDLAEYRLFRQERGFFAGYPEQAAELPDLLSTGVPPDSDGLLYANTLGIGLEDLVLAQLVYRAAERCGVGVRWSPY